MAMPKQLSPFLRKETEEKIIHTAIEMVEKKKPFPARTDRGQVEGYKVLRREAVKIVAQANVPVIGDKDRPALTLAKVAGNDESIQPSPRLDERIEASIGLARMSATAGKFPDYQPDYAALQIANTVLTFGLESAKPGNEKSATRSRPWKIDAARLGEAVDALKANVKSPYVQQLADQCLLILRPLEDGRDANANNLGDWLSTNSCPVKTLFKSGADSAIKPAGEAPAKPAEDAKAKPPAEKK
jgi:hypothetical protein